MSIDFSLDSVPDGQEDPSTVGPVNRSNKGYQWTEEWWANDADPKVVRCKAHRKNGNQCLKAAMNGTTVCRNHGGRAPQVQFKAKMRIQEAADRAARELLGMMVDTSVPEGVRLSAIKDVLDRGGLGVKSQMEIEVSAKPFERVFDRIGSGPRDELPTRDQADRDEAGSLKARLALKRSTNEYSDIED